MSAHHQTLESHLQVGTKAVIVSHPDNPDSPRFVVSLSGWRRDEFLVFDLPSRGNKKSDIIGNSLRRLPVRPKSEIIVRFIAGGDVCAFRETVTDTFLMGDLPHFTVRWPRSFDTLRVREVERYEVVSPVRIARADCTLVEGTSVDMCLKGCAVVLDQSFEVGDSVTIAFDLPDATPIAGIKGTVRYCRPADDAGIRVGIHYDEVPHQAERDLDTYFHMLSADLTCTPEESKVLILLTGRGDDPGNLGKLSVPGFDLVVAYDVAEFFYRLRILRPVGVIVDCWQQGWSGIDVCSYVRSNQRLNGVMLILVGITDEHVDATSRLLGADVCVPKRICDPEAVQKMIVEGIAQRIASFAGA